ncbi:MAG: AsmA family protein [Desulfovibrionaceae bacterium]|jgi:AsmA protein|nr:AsmA family protein [Desulfovibrionaceae bacterium]
MNKFLKILLILVGAVAALIIAAMIVLPMVVDPNDYKDEIAALVKENTGRELVFSGDLKLSVFPWLGVEIGPTRLSDDPAFGKRDFVSLQGVDVKVALLPLLSGSYKVKNLTLSGLNVVLTRDAKGRGNWESLGGAAEAAPQAAEPKGQEKTAEPATAEGAGGLPDVTVGAVSVTDAQVAYQDLATGESYTITGLTLQTGRLQLADPSAFTDLTLAFKARSAKPAIDADVTLSARANMNEDKKLFALRDLDLKAAARGSVFPSGQADAAVTAQAIDVDMGAQRAAVQGLTLAAYKLRLAADATVTGLDAAPAYSGALTLEPGDLRAALAALGSPLPEMKDPAALTRVGAKVRFEGTTARAAIPELALDLDGAAVTGAARADDFTHPTVSFALAADALDADRYMSKGGAAKAEPAASGQKAEKKDGAKDGGKDAGLIDEATRKALRALVLDGKVDVGALTVSGARLEKVHMTVTARDGLLRIDPLTALLYGGSYKTTAQLDVRPAAPAFKLDASLDKLGLGNLLKDMTGNEFLSGNTDLALNLAGAGNDAKALLRSLSGAANLAVLDGAFHGFQIVPNDTAKHLQNDAQRKALESAGKRQEFDAIRASFKIARGVVSNNDLSLASKNLNAKGGGIVDLAAGKMDYLAYVDIPAMPLLPLRADGPLDDLSYGLDTTEFAKGLAKSVLNAPVNLGKSVLGGVGGALGLTDDDSAKKSSGSSGSGTSGSSDKSSGGLLDSIGSIFGGSKK